MASEAAITRFLEGLRVDLVDTGITVSDVQPGFVDSAGTGRREAYPMPFMLDLDEAVAHILAAIDHRTPVAAFPRSPAALFSASRLVPAAAYETVAAWLTRRSEPRSSSPGAGADRGFR